MAKKKKEEEVKETAPPFDWSESILDMEISDGMKAGFIYYITNNNITIKSENDLTKQFNKFKEMNAGA